MGHRKLTAALLGVLILGGGVSAWLVGCTVAVRSGSVTFTVLGKIFTLTFEDIGSIATQANETAEVPAAVRLFEEPPPQTPPSGQMTLPSTSVGVARRLAAKTIVRSQVLPLNGSATIRFNIAAGTSAALCDSAILLAEFELALTMGVAAILDEVYDLSQQGLAVMMANDVTICIEITADFDGEITIGEYQLAFGGGPGGGPPPSPAVSPPVLPGGLTLIPIDNLGGLAVLAPFNRTVGGVIYGVVGVLEAQTSSVSTATAEPNLITVVPGELGLLTVETLYIGTHSSFVPDVVGGVTLATLTVSYTDAGSPTTVDFVTGSTTAEWSYDRPEHATMYGGVQHSQAPVLYSFETSIDSTSAYNGYSYSVTMPVDSSRTISALSLSMADPATYAASRLASGDPSGWASQALTAITLAGQVLEIPQEQACCLHDGSCTDLEQDDCIARSGEPMGERSDCASADCPIPDSDLPEVCCVAGVETISRQFSQFCVEYDREECLASNGVPQGPGSTCDTTICDEDFLACCDPASDDCEDLLYDTCVARGWQPKAFGVHCNDFKCPSDDEACCFDDGQCVDVDPDTCVANGGTPGGAGTSCGSLTCLGACCALDLTCTQTSLDQCDAAGGEYRGHGVNCDSDTCLGGCCFNDTVFCFGELSSADCVASGGEPQTSCSPDPCPFACCLPDETCTEGLSVDECSGEGGTVNARGTSCASTDCESPPEYVVWYTSNVCCWGAPHIRITDRDGFEAPDLRMNWSGGGIDPSEPLTKAELQGGFASEDEARAWLCPQFTSWTSHYWCGSHTQGPLGGNWQGTAGCTIDPPLPQADTAPEFDGCE